MVTMNRLHDMFGALRKRRIVQVGVIYLGAAFALLEAVGFLQDNYALSPKLVDVTLLLLVLGFPALLIIAWYHGEKGHQEVVKTELSLLLTLAVLAAVGTYRIGTGQPAVESGTPAVDTGANRFASLGRADLGDRSLVVLPFENNTAGDSLDWLGPGIADMLTTNFAQLAELTVVSRQRLFDLLRERGSDETEEIPDELASSVAIEAGAHLMVRGSVMGAGDQLRVDAQLIELESGTVVAAAQARGSDIFTLVDSVTQELSDEMLRGEVQPTEMAPLAAVTTKDLEAYREYQLGLRAARMDQSDEARERFERAAALDSSFVLPLVALAVESPEVADSATRDIYVTRARNALSRQARVQPPAMGRVVRLSMAGHDSIVIVVDSILQAVLRAEESTLEGVSVQMEMLQGEMDELRMESEVRIESGPTPPPQP